MIGGLLRVQRPLKAVTFEGSDLFSEGSFEGSDICVRNLIGGLQSGSSQSGGLRSHSLLIALESLQLGGLQSVWGLTISRHRFFEGSQSTPNCAGAYSLGAYGGLQWGLQSHAVDF